MPTLTDTTSDTLNMQPLNVSGTDLTTITIPDIKAVGEGAAAWERIKKASKMLREDWRLVGEALLVGRQIHKSDRLFGQWCRENGFVDMDRRIRADAIWLVENWPTVHDVDSSICHPTHIRTTYNRSVLAWARIEAVTHALKDETSAVNVEAFDEWLVESGLEGLDFQTCYDGTWLAANWKDIEVLTRSGFLRMDLSHPTAIREAYNVARLARST